MKTRANQGGSAIVYGIVSVILALAVVGAVYAVQKRAAGEEVGPMEIAANLGDSNEKESTNEESSSDDKKQAEKDAADKKAAEERERAAEQAAEEKKAEEQRQAAAEEARTESEQSAQRESATEDDESQGAALPSTGGPSELPQTGSADYIFGGLALTALGISIFKFAFSHRYVTGR